MKSVMALLLFFIGNAAVFKPTAERGEDGFAKRPPIPKGFVLVGDDLLVGETEVSLGQWHEFMSEMEGAPDLHPAPNPFNGCLDYLDGDPEYVYRDTTFTSVGLKRQRTRSVQLLCKKLPVTGITIEQAEAYCRWLTERFRKDPVLPDYTFRLPTEKEYYTFMERNMEVMGEKFREYFRKGLNDKGCAFYNHRHEYWCESNLEMKLMYGVMSPRPVFHSIPSSDGLWELFGNVAELTQTKGVAKGGAYNLPASECQPESVNRYEGPQPWIGFRVIADVAD